MLMSEAIAFEKFYTMNYPNKEGYVEFILMNDKALLLRLGMIDPETPLIRINE